MNMNDRQLLKSQLEQQARMFVVEQDNMKLAVSVLTTCIGLLRVAEKNMPKTFSQQEFDNVFAGYLGIAKRGKAFYERNSSSLSETESEMLKQVLKSLDEVEQEKEKLELKVTEVRKKNAAVESEVKRLELHFEEEAKRKLKLEEKQLELKEKLGNVQFRISELEKELVDMNSKIDNLEPSIELLINNVNAARDTYEEMLAYYSELKRIEEGIKEEGFVDVESFSNRLQTMNDSGKEIMNQYDSILKKLTEDIEVLQAKIETRRKAGV